MPNYVYLGYLCGKVKDKKKLIDSISTLEKKDIFILVIPCWSIIDYSHINHAILLALRDFKTQEIKARKISLQILLRFLGENQIAKALSKIEISDNDPICILVITTLKDMKILDHVKNILLEANAVYNLTKDFICQPDLDKIKALYSIKKEEINAVSRSDDERIEHLYKKIILERIALTFLK